ncbi:hypothetical protein LINPERHAP1_LOCUS38842 [Linum perenne]
MSSMWSYERRKRRRLCRHLSWMMISKFPFFHRLGRERRLSLREPVQAASFPLLIPLK